MKLNGLLATQIAMLFATAACSRAPAAGAPTKARSAATASPEAAKGRARRLPHGVAVTPAAGAAATVRLTVVSPKIVRVTASPNARLEAGRSLMVVASPQEVPFETEQNGETFSLKTANLRADVSLVSGSVTFFNAAGVELLASVGPGTFAPVEVEGQQYFAIGQEFNRGTDEGLYGLGAHQNGQFNYNGEDVELAQHNIVDVVPFLVSTRNYGILWDNNGISRFGVPHAYRPLAEQLLVTDAGGNEGGLTGHYYLGAEELLTTREADPNYQYLPADQFLRTPPARGAWPAPFEERSPSRVVWEGALEARGAGVHKFRLYASSYYKLWVDDQLLVDRWRQNWNPWYHNFEVAMAPGEKHRLRVEWQPNDGYFRLLHQPPLPQPERHQIALSSEVARSLDYYVVVAEDLDGVIAGYRELTGPAVLLPRWAYGFWQSRQRYETQEQLLSVVKEYRRRRIPIDNIVLDWFYWKPDNWGSHEFDASRFPDPGGMVDQVHAMNAQIMVSVWPKFYPETSNFQELDKAGHIYRRQLEMRSLDWVDKGYRNAFYDPYSENARKIFYRQLHENLGARGFDAWWLDATEPDSHSNLDYTERALRMGPTALGPGAEFFNSYVLPHSRAVFEGERGTKPDRRTFQLTRSAWGGMQRYGAMNWSGDVAARWEDLALQIPAGLNLSLSGLPNWTHDIGGFAVEPRFSSGDPAHQQEWRELYLRWFQFGALSPVFRSHGELPHRETFNIAPASSEVYDSLVYYHRLRYRLLPYIYTLAADTYHNHGTLMRPLVMDFPSDPRVRNLGDQYLFGRGLLVAPVTEYQARSRRLYLPAGADWYDFYTGEHFTGGREIEAAAPLHRIPLFARAGAIIPMGPDVQYAAENPAGPLMLRVYTGANGAFSLYEDDGVTYGHQRGQFTRIPIAYDDRTGELTVGPRRGRFAGMPGRRTLSVQFISQPAGGAPQAVQAPAQAVAFDGAAVTLRRP